MQRDSTLEEAHLVGWLVVGHGVGVLDVKDAVGDGAKEGPNYAFGLVGGPDVAVTDVEEDNGVQPRRQDRRRRREAVYYRHDIGARQRFGFWGTGQEGARLIVGLIGRAGCNFVYGLGWTDFGYPNDHYIGSSTTRDHQIRFCFQHLLRSTWSFVTVP